MTSAERAVERARQLVGSRFRPQGRRPDVGLDCVGLICAAFDIPAAIVPSDYRLRGRHAGMLDRELRRFFCALPGKEPAAGDVGLFEAGPDQVHLAVVTGSGFIHADARLRRVTECPGRPPWPMLALYRRAANVTEGTE